MANLYEKFKAFDRGATGAEYTNGCYEGLIKQGRTHIGLASLCGGREKAQAVEAMLNDTYKITHGSHALIYLAKTDAYLVPYFNEGNNKTEWAVLVKDKKLEDLNHEDSYALGNSWYAKELRKQKDKRKSWKLRLMSYILGRNLQKDEQDNKTFNALERQWERTSTVDFNALAQHKAVKKETLTGEEEQKEMFGTLHNWFHKLLFQKRDQYGNLIVPAPVVFMTT